MVDRSTPHLMFDLETLGTRPGCVILSVGAVIFNPFMPSAVRAEEFYQNISKESCLEWDMHTDPATEAWWEGQSEEAKAALLINQKPLKEVLWDFSAWVERNQIEQVWCHGLTFDVPIIEEAYRRCGMLVPWSFRNCRDTRTLYALLDFSPSEVLPDRGTHHNALHDSRYQADSVTAAYSHFHQITEGQ